MNNIEQNSYKLVDNYGQTYKLTGSIIQIGSGAGRTIVLDDDPNVIDLHAELRCDDSNWNLFDFSGGKLITINNREFQNNSRLNDGDIIKIGNTILRFQVIQPVNSEVSSSNEIFRSTGESKLVNPPPPDTSTMQPKKRCITCNREIFQAAEICPYCGVRQSKPQPIAKHSRTTAAILAIILGDFGAHKFYLGKIGLGFLYLVFCWAYVPGILGIIEGISYLTMSDEKFAQKYG